MGSSTFGYVTPENLALFTDLYELTMLQGYHEAGHEPRATFDLFFRSLPPDRGYAVVAGVEQALRYVTDLSFGDRALAYLEAKGFHGDFLDRLSSFEFTGDVRAMPEGTAVFPNEPMLEVEGPLFEAQLFETALINQVGFQTLVATKAARMRDAVDRNGGDQTLVDFGSRRAHGTDAGVKAARAAYVGGFDGTSNVAAGELFDLPVYGTMAHSWVQSFPSEREAFEAFVSVYGSESVLLVDTYDTVEGTRLAMDVAAAEGVDVAGVRLDSGDLVALSKEVSEFFDGDVFVSSGVDEYEIDRFLREGGLADGFGPGTALTTSTDAPKLEAVYKLVGVERDGEMRPSMKLSTGKVTYPGAKSVRRVERDGRFERDVLAERGEDAPGEELLETVVADGEAVADPPSLDDARARRAANLSKLPEGVRALRSPEAYPVETSEGLDATTGTVRAELEEMVRDRTR
ncbi:MAG: nicotinate phosphoribosyltransferase [Haloferacaceae archaeon]